MTGRRCAKLTSLSRTVLSPSTRTAAVPITTTRPSLSVCAVSANAKAVLAPTENTEIEP